MNFKTEITKIHYGQSAKYMFLLVFASFFYEIASRLKNFLYDKNIINPKSVEAFVISVGNITTGGVGKTPVVCEIAKHLISKNKRVAIVSRGYGGQLSNRNINVISNGEKIFYDAKDAGDEPYWLASNTNAIVITSKNRYEASKFAIENFGVTHIILDDGFQHRKLKRDLDIVLVDSEKQFGNNRLLPAGPLREGFEAFKRADKIVVVSKNINHEKAFEYAKNLKDKTGVDTLVCKNTIDEVYNIKTKTLLPKGADISAICAIGQPEQFYAFLSDYNIKTKISFDDHHIYKEIELPEGIIVTTEKDAVKMQNFKRNDIYAMRLKTVLDVEEVCQKFCL